MISPEMLEKIEELLQELRELSNEGVPIIVEGESDARALRELGVEGPIRQISSDKRTALNFLEGLSGHDRIVILTDFDRAGGGLARFCTKHLESLDTEAVLEPRKKLKALVRKFVKDVEGLAKFLRNQRAALKR